MRPSTSLQYTEKEVQRKEGYKKDNCTTRPSTFRPIKFYFNICHPWIIPLNIIKQSRMLWD